MVKVTIEATGKEKQILSEFRKKNLKKNNFFIKKD